MGAIELHKWDSAAYLQTEEDRALYLEACMEEAGDDTAFMAKALANIARASDTPIGKSSPAGFGSIKAENHPLQHAYIQAILLGASFK